MLRQDQIFYYLDNLSGCRSHFNTKCKRGVRHSNIYCISNRKDTNIFALEIGHSACSMANTWMLERALRRERVFRDRDNPLDNPLQSGVLLPKRK